MKFLIAVLLSLTSVAYAGHGEGNGGGAIVCADGKGEITSAKLLDLWEMEQKYPGSIERSEDAKEIQLERAVNRLRNYDGALAEKVERVLATLDQKKITHLASEGMLAPPNDTMIKFLKSPRNCPLTGAAIYNDQEDTLTIDSEVLGKMSETDLAALDFHEALYKVQRIDIAKSSNSVSARLITGGIFSNLPNLPGWVNATEGAENATYRCDSVAGDLIYIHPVNKSESLVQVVQIFGSRMFDKTIFKVDANNSKFKMETRLSSGFERWKRTEIPSDKIGMDLSPYAVGLTSQTYGPSLYLTLSTYDELEYEDCVGKKTCNHWVSKKKTRFFNAGVYITADTVRYSEREGNPPMKLTCKNNNQQ